MSIELKMKEGLVTITNEVIATIAGGAAIECYGIVGMASKKQLRDGIAEILRKENFAKGVIVRQDNEDIHIDMYIIVGYGTKISEVAHNVQSQVKYNLEKTLGLQIKSINIYIQGVRVIQD
ncbi:Asp23/Gls24 family envelope stress response protein [Gracilibacillus alcaliphilus]|uniref:Asp23/Gls24 family envelope stress response protein n=1 Tax=Gracilibacillus alcaliphilus TaxID=1401441 RepID=UPI00195A9BCA|nr:Asp23/Gls24 family envelope stress response protein [Gracilibacillus alcaliphilus]MBM7678333.1 putative alkaline shock family protein YloU [Gracilibacillus alcaliphilus]